MLRPILADALARVPELPREDAARAERALMMFEAVIRPDGGEGSKRLAQFVTDYRGTRTAAAHITIGYSGGTVELEKEDGRWVVRRLTDQWIT